MYQTSEFQGEKSELFHKLTLFHGVYTYAATSQAFMFPLMVWWVVLVHPTLHLYGVFFMV